MNPTRSLVLGIHRAEEVTARDFPNLHGLVKAVSARADMRTPRIYLVDSDQLNAFAIGGALVLTKRTLHALSDWELRAVVARAMVRHDERAVRIAGDPESLARALEKMATAASYAAHPFGMWLLGRLYVLDPWANGRDTYERIERLRRMRRAPIQPEELAA